MDKTDVRLTRCTNPFAFLMVEQMLLDHGIPYLPRSQRHEQIPQRPDRFRHGCHGDRPIYPPSHLRQSAGPFGEMAKQPPIDADAADWDDAPSLEEADDVEKADDIDEAE